LRTGCILFAGIVGLILEFGAVFPARSAETPDTQKLRALLEAPPPDPKEHSKAALVKIYLERGRAASTFGDFDRELKEILAGIRAVGPKDPAYSVSCSKQVLALKGSNPTPARHSATPIRCSGRLLWLSVTGANNRRGEYSTDFSQIIA
jgi:hypothetical protein